MRINKLANNVYEPDDINQLTWNGSDFILINYLSSFD